MTQDDRVNRMEDQLIDMRLAVSALLETVTQHQRNFETIQGTLESYNQRFTAIMTEIRDIRLDMQECGQICKKCNPRLEVYKPRIAGF